MDIQREINWLYDYLEWLAAQPLKEPDADGVYRYSIEQIQDQQRMYQATANIHYGTKNGKITLPLERTQRGTYQPR